MGDPRLGSDFNLEETGKHSQHTNEINAVAATLVERSPSSCDSEDAPICWICLDSTGELTLPCKCPRMAHVRCLARWQLQSAGTKRERFCEFCNAQLPDWKAILTPKCGANAPAVMNVNFDGRTYSFEVKPGPEGYRLFTEAIRRAFNLPEDSELNITFTCDEPTVPELGNLLTLQGPGAYDAAVHCASVSAARRLSSPVISRAPSVASELAGPVTPRSLLGYPHQRTSSYATPSSAGESIGPLGSGSPPLVQPVTRPRRRLSSLSRKIRLALTDFFNSAADGGDQS